jgi:hypothetical protein
VSQSPQIGQSSSARFPSSALDVRRRLLVRLRLSIRRQPSALLLSNVL